MSNGQTVIIINNTVNNFVIIDNSTHVNVNKVNEETKEKPKPKNLLRRMMIEIFNKTWPHLIPIALAAISSYLK